MQMYQISCKQRPPTNFGGNVFSSAHLGYSRLKNGIFVYHSDTLLISTFDTSFGVPTDILIMDDLISAKWRVMSRGMQRGRLLRVPEQQTWNFHARLHAVRLNVYSHILGQVVAGSSKHYAQSGAATISSFPYVYCF